MHLTRDLAVFEVYNPYSIVQLSEVLSDFRIIRGERTIYSGRAVATSIVTTGLMIIVSATLIDPWSDLAGVAPGEGLREEVEGFVRDWDENYTLVPDYELSVSKISSFLSELSRWLDHLEMGVQKGEVDPEMAHSEEFLAEVRDGVLPKMNDLFVGLEEQAQKIPSEVAVVHKAFTRRQLHPLILRSPFVHRTFTKPLGYAGDYEMVNMILRDPAEGPTTYAKILNCWYLATAPAEAHRNRIAMLVELLGGVVKQAAAAGRELRVLNVGCGPAGEVQRLITSGSLAGQCEFHLLDFNEETLDHARAQIDAACGQGTTRPKIEYVHKSIHQLLKEATGRRGTPEAKYDMVYCAGLFDYLSDRICERLLKLYWGWTLPGGMIIATNVHTRNPFRHFMEHVLEWYLEHRDERTMRDLAPDQADAEVTTDPTGVNVFLKIRKADKGNA